MKVPLTIPDFLDRAVTVYPERVAFVDEPDQPGPSWGSITYREVGRRARAQAAALDRLGVGQGERVAVVSHNSARLLTSFFGVSGSGRILVPVNFRLAAEEVRYIVEHSGSSVLLVDPELEDVLGDVTAAHRFTIGHEADAAASNASGQQQQGKQRHQRRKEPRRSDNNRVRVRLHARCLSDPRSPKPNAATHPAPATNTSGASQKLSPLNSF